MHKSSSLGVNLIDCSRFWIKSALSFLFFCLFFSCYPPLFLIPGRVSWVQAFACPKVLLTCSSVGILVKAGLRKACTKAFVPCLNGSTRPPPSTTRKAGESQEVFPWSLLSSLLFAYSHWFPDKVLACAYWPSSHFPLKGAGLQKLGFGGERPPLSSTPGMVNGWRTHFYCHCSNSSACRLALMTEKWLPFG